MTAEEIRACAAFLTEADDISSTLSKQSDALQATRARLSAEEKQVDQDRKFVDARAEKQVKAFNARVQSMHDSVRSFNQSIDEYNASVQRANSLQRSFNVECADRPYRLADLMALSAKERAAMKTGSTPFDLPVYSDKPAPRTEDLRSRDRESCSRHEPASCRLARGRLRCAASAARTDRSESSFEGLIPIAVGFHSGQIRATRAVESGMCATGYPFHNDGPHPHHVAALP